MKKSSLATTLMAMLALPIIAERNLLAAYGYIAFFLLVAGWNVKKPTQEAD